MNRPTFGDLRDSMLPRVIGVCADSVQELARWVNEAQERLLMDPLAPDEGWIGGWARMAFNVTQGSPYIVTPREVARLIVMDVCKKPVKIRNGFYEFLDFGSGLTPVGCDVCPSCQSLQAFERETVPTLSSLVGTKYVRAYISDTRDRNRRVLVQGADNNSITVISTDTNTSQAILGEYISCDLPFETSVNQFSTITGMIKDVTYGPVTLKQVDPATLVETDLSVMEPHETVGYYRKYYINGLSTCCGSTTTQVYAMAKLDFVPVKSDPDYLIIQSIPALIEEVQAIRKSRMDDDGAQQQSERHHQRALQILFGQLDHYQGKQSAVISVPIFGSDKLRAMAR